MASIEIGTLSDRLSDDEVGEVTKALAKLGVSQLPRGDEGVSSKIAKGIDEDVLAEFMDHLEANDVSCDIYLPVEFDGTALAADRRVGSVPALLDVLEELKEELDISDDEDEDDDDEDEDDDEDYGGEIGLVEERLREVWQHFFDGAQAAMDRQIALFIVST